MILGWSNDNHRLSLNSLTLNELLRDGKVYSYGKVYLFCIKEQDGFLEKNQNLRFLYKKEKVSDEGHAVYQKHVDLKNKINEDYQYHLAMKTLIQV